LFRGDIGPGNYVLVNTNGTVYLSSSPKQIAESEMGFYRFVIDANHFKKVFQSLICLFVQEEVEALQVVDVQRRRRLTLIVTFIEAT
jgi:hypothetical protein